MARAFVFDAYGTLFDVHAAIARHRGAAGPEADRFSEIWRTKQLEYAWMLSAAGHYVDFWTLTERALDHAFAREPSVDTALRARLLEAYFKLDAFPDARAALTALKAKGMRTAILSNGNPRMLGGDVWPAPTSLSRQRREDARPGARALVERLEVVFLVRRMHAVVIKAEADQQRVHAEYILEVADNRNRSARADRNRLGAPFLRQ